MREELRISVPYEIATVRPLRKTTSAERAAILREAHYNTELLPQEAVYIDLKTDSAVGARSTVQMMAMMEPSLREASPELAGESHRGLRSLASRANQLFGFPYTVPCVQGRAAERLWLRQRLRKGTLVPGNLLFPSTRFHIASNGGEFSAVALESAYDLFSGEPFKGNLEPNRLEALIDETGKDHIACVYLELCVNSCGGHPVSLAHLAELEKMLRPRSIPLFLDATRIVENSYLIQKRESVFSNRSLAEIIRETCSHADAITLSAQKDFCVPGAGLVCLRDEKLYHQLAFETFLDGSAPDNATMRALEVALEDTLKNEGYVTARARQVSYLWERLSKAGLPVLRPCGGHAVYIDVCSILPAMSDEHFPAEALAAYVYVISGIRITKGPALTREQRDRGLNLIRLAVPSHRYLPGHFDDVAAALHCAFERRGEIRGLRPIESPGRSKYGPPLFELREP